jgi:hypothetical protein
VLGTSSNAFSSAKSWMVPLCRPSGSEAALILAHGPRRWRGINALSLTVAKLPLRALRAERERLGKSRDCASAKSELGSRAIRRGVLIQLGAAGALCALAAAIQLVPDTCPANRFTATTISLIAVGGLLVFVTAAYALSPEETGAGQWRRSRLTSVGAAAALALVIAAFVTLLVSKAGPACG